jgi:muramoyltetrapeptide carboxypeptidase
MNNTQNIIWPNAIELGAQDRLVAGAVVLSAPEAAINPEYTERGVNWLKQRGCECKLAAHYQGVNSFLAGAPNEISQDLHELLADPEVDWIISAGGGYNSNILLPYLNYEAILEARKPIIGLSNPSVLLNAITAKTGLVTYHGPVLLWNFGSEDGIDGFTEKHLREMLAGKNGEIIIEQEPEWQWLRTGNARGRLFGGNLWSIQQLIGTPYEPDWRGAVLFIEDCFCELHQIAAILEHFKAAGVFSKINGLISGIPLEVKETELSYDGTFNDVIMDVVAEYDFPVLANVHLGHTDRKLTMPIGAPCSLDHQNNRIIFERN